MAKGGKIQMALDHIDKWMPDDFELQKEYYQLINDKDQKGMEEFLDMYADQDRLMRYDIQYEDLGKLSEAIISGSEYAKGGKTSGIKDYLETLESDQIFDLCNDFYYDDEEWHEIKNDLDKDDLIQWAYDYCKKNKISLKDLKDVLGDREDEIADMKKMLQSNLIPYLDIAGKNPGVINLRVYNKDSFAFYNKNDNCKVAINYNYDSKSVIMYQEWDNGNMDDDEVSLLTFENYLSNTKMADGGDIKINDMKHIAYIEDSRRPGGSDKSIKKTYNLDVEDRSSDGFYVAGSKEDIEDFINDYSINFAEIKEYMAKGGPTKKVIKKKMFDINDDEISEDIFEWAMENVPEEFEFEEDEEESFRNSNFEDVIEEINSRLEDYELLVDYEEDRIYVNIYKKDNMAKGGATSKYNVGDTVVYYNREGKITKGGLPNKTLNIALAGTGVGNQGKRPAPVPIPVQGLLVGPTKDVDVVVGLNDGRLPRDRVASKADCLLGATIGEETHLVVRNHHYPSLPHIVGVRVDTGGKDGGGDVVGEHRGPVLSHGHKLVKMADKRTTVNYRRVYPVGHRMTDSMFGSLSYDVKVKGVLKRRNMTVGTFIKKNPKGTFFVLVKGHAFTIKDGVVIGNYEDAVKTKKIMRCAFEIK